MTTSQDLYEKAVSCDNYVDFDNVDFTINNPNWEVHYKRGSHVRYVNTNTGDNELCPPGATTIRGDDNPDDKRTFLTMTTQLRDNYILFRARVTILGTSLTIGEYTYGKDFYEVWAWAQDWMEEHEQFGPEDEA